VQGESVSLTTAEYDLLHLLAENQGQVVSRDTIVQSLRGFDYDGLDRSIDRRISRLRKKLNDDPVEPTIIKTVRGKGYLLCLSVVH
jgi:two-component system OmpR family response regulator/two-component system response regulator RstA